MEISAKCGYLSLLTWQPYVHALSPQWIHALAFWKHRLACSLAISTSIYSQCNLSSVHLWESKRERERERARERERDAVYGMNFHSNIEACGFNSFRNNYVTSSLLWKDNVCVCVCGVWCCVCVWWCVCVCVWWDLVKTAHEFRTLLIFFFNVESVLICAIITYQQC